MGHIRQYPEQINQKDILIGFTAVIRKCKPVLCIFENLSFHCFILILYVFFNFRTPKHILCWNCDTFGIKNFLYKKSSIYAQLIFLCISFRNIPKIKLKNKLI